MNHDIPLILTVVVGLGLAFVLGTIAHRFKAPPLVGYLIAGVLIGPYTPGFVADQDLANQLAELGVILLMFGVGLHFSLKDLLSVKGIAVPGAIVQMAIATGLGLGLALWLGWSLEAGLVFGLALSVASTVVLLKALQERRLIDTERGRIAVGWLIVEDLAMVLALVIIPAIGGVIATHGGEEVIGDALVAEPGQSVWVALGLTGLKVVGFVAFMLIVGRRVIPWILHYIAHTGSRELFRLAVLAIALGVALGAAQLFDVSLALGAFFAGMILAESALAHRAAEESLPLRDAFAVLFFVSVGMLFDPATLIENPLPVLGVLLIIVFGKSLAAFAIVILFGYPVGTALVISASLAQIGEFSFILAELGVGLGMLPQEGRDLILAGAILSILLNPVFFYGVDRLKLRLERRAAAAAAAAAGPLPAPQTAAERERADDEAMLRASRMTDHTVLVGYGRVGSIVGEALRKAQVPFLVIEDVDRIATELHQNGIEVIHGNAAAPAIISAANLGAAHRLIVAIPNAFEAANIVQAGRAANTGMSIVARAHSDAEVAHLRSHGADIVIMAEREVAKSILAEVLPAPAAREI
ncbi:MAG: Kef family K(+) transporter [Bauldia sp.]|nr:Kef family K(+) transporter [Bauldia sp.]MCW5719051.1 Kef family K(+) transporter [Bauldia sp.]